MKRWHLAAVAALLLLIAALCLVRAAEAQRPKGSDTDQIRSLIAACAKAAQARDSAPIRRFISNDYKDSNGFRADAIRAQVAHVIAGSRSVSAYLPASSVQVQVDPGGQLASATFQVHFLAASRNGDLRFDGPINLRLAREPVRYYLLFPGHEWRVVAATGYPAGTEWFD